MAAARAGSPAQNRQTVHADQAKAVNELRTAMNAAALASGAFNVQTVKTISAGERLTNQIRDQKIGYTQARKEMRAYHKEMKGGPTSALGDAIRQQSALRNSMATQWPGGNAFGRNSTDMYIPKNLGSELDNINTKYGMMNRMLYSAAQQTVNWGKNTQWAGRQIMVGLGVPLGMLAVGAGVVAMKVDQELTRVAKVYDTVATTAEGRERELTQVRNVGLKQASNLAQEYGTKMEDVIDIQAQLSATGLNGNKLFSSTREAARIATLGEMDMQPSIDMTVALQTAFRDTIKTSEDLTDTFNFFNSVENATSLAIQDIAEATPRAASAMAALGVDAKEMTVMLVAMKESGVDAAEAANALKSGATRILDPTREAVQYWKDVLDKDLPAIVSKAGGNMFEFIKEVSVALNGLDPQTVQTAVAKTFGTYQFNRITALIGNMGDALTGTANQTAKGFELLGVSAEENAMRAEQELSKLQESMSFKFKAAIQSIKAELVPFGEVVLKTATLLMNYLIKPIISGFNALGDGSKMFILILMGLGAVAGPLLMISGIFANLFGNVMKLSYQLGNLKYRFSAMTIDERAAAMNARAASSAFTTEAGAAANLATQIGILTRQMEMNAIAAGHMMAANGKINTVVNGQIIGHRQVEKRSNGTYGYAAPPVFAPGTTKAERKIISQQDFARFKEIEKASANTAGSAAKTERHMTGAGKAVGVLAVGALAMGTFASGSASAHGSWINIAMLVGMVAMMMPGLFTAPLARIGLMVAGLRTAGSGAVMGRLLAQSTMVSRSFTTAWRGGASLSGSLITAGRTLIGFLPMALRIFGPLGLIAGAAIYLKKMNDEMMQVKDNALAISGATKDWADAQGWDFNPGQMPGMKPEEVKGHQARIELIEKMTKANEDLDDAMVAAAQSGTAYDRALDMAMSSLTAGASIEDAEEQFQAALDMAGLKEAEIEKLTLRFRNLDLANPENLRDQLNKALQDTVGDLGSDITVNIRPSDDQGGGVGGFFKGIGNGLMENLGRDLTPEAEAAATILGGRFATAFSAAGEDQFKQADAINAAAKSYDTLFSDMYDNIADTDNEKVTAAFKSLGVDSASTFVQTMNQIIAQSETEEGYEKLTAAQKTLMDAYADDSDMVDMVKSADQYWDNFVDSMVTAGQMTEAEGNLMKEQLSGLLDLRDNLDIPATGTISATQALSNYQTEIEEARVKGRAMTNEQKDARRAYWLAAAGLEDGTLAAKGFGKASGEAAKEVQELKDAAAGLMQVTADDLVGAQKDAMSGTMSDIFAEADRQFQDMQAANLDSIRAAGDARQEAMQAEGELMDAEYQNREDMMAWYWDVREQGMEDEWEAREEALEADMDRRIEAEEAYWDSRIEGVEDSIEAEQKAEEKRQEIFENEQRRIDRMAASLNSNIDFNVAVNSGDMDAAAKIANDAIAQQSSWNLEDQNRDATSESDARVEKLNEELEELQTLKDARLEEIKTVQDARKKALQEEQEAAKAQFAFLRSISEQQLQAERDVAKKALDARMEADRKSTESAVKETQAQADAQRRAMEIELKTLQEFVPKNEQELRDHTAKVTAIYNKYGLDLQFEGGKWGAFVGEALRVNVEASSIAMQNQIDWRAIAANIAQQIGDGLGMTMQQVQDFLRTGVFPATPPRAPVGPVLPGKSSAQSSANAAEHRAGFQHIGGVVGEAGTGQRDRSGISRSASPYSSEQMILAKKGEFLVNDKASRKNRGLLDAINGGKDIGGTGLLEHTAAQTAMSMAGVAQMMGMVAYEKVRQGKAAYEAEQAALAASAGGSTGTIAGGNAPWERLWNTIRARFPAAGLNDSTRPGARDYHGQGMAVDLGLRGTPGGNGNMFMADMNRWIYDNFRGSTELIYNGLGDDRPNLKNGMNYAYSPGIQASHRNHVHWAMTPAAIAAAGAKIASGAVSQPGGGSGDVRSQVMAAAAQRGWNVGANWDAIDWIISKESSWNPNAQNPVSTASGLFQHIDGTWNAYKRPGVSAPKMRLAPVNEQAWAGMNYMAGRYGNPASARAFWQQKGWYDDGGYLQPGNTLAMNGTRKPEPVFTGPQWDILKANIGNNTYDVPGTASAPMPVRIMDNVANGGETRYDVTVDLRGAVIKDEIDFQAGVEKALDNIESRKGRRRVIK